MPIDTLITIEGIECYAHHGCMEAEGAIGARYHVDVYVWADVHRAVQTDNLEDTVDYVMVYNVVKAQMAIRSKLIEHVCGRIVDGLKDEMTALSKLRVRVTKYNPPVNGEVEKTSVELTYEP